MGKEEFKAFVQDKPELVDYIEDGSMTWQKFYEIYDMYGSSQKVWDKYKGKKTTTKKVSDFMDKLDADSIQSHIETAQKALNFISELTAKGSETIASSGVTNVERPITKFFGD